MLSRVAKFPAEEHHVSNKVTHLSHVLITMSKERTREDWKPTCDFHLYFWRTGGAECCDESSHFHKLPGTKIRHSLRSFAYRNSD